MNAMKGTTGTAAATATTATTAKKCYVLLHGALHGGWCWRDVAAILRAEGHQVTTPTQTGLGERRHLLSADITLATFGDDLVNHIESEELHDVVLVGHSFGGCAISIAADRIRDRIRHLVYLDGLVLQNGQTGFDMIAPHVVAARRALIASKGQGLFLPVVPVTTFDIPADHPEAAWVARRLTPHPASTYDSPMSLQHPVGNGLPRTYIACTAPAYAPLAPVRDWVRTQPGWAWQELATGHDAMVTDPAGVAAMLLGIG